MPGEDVVNKSFSGLAWLLRTCYCKLRHHRICIFVEVMKNSVFCLLVLLAFFRPDNLYATGSQQIYKTGNVQKESLSCDHGFLKSYDDLLELMEDDNNEPNDENYCSGNSDAGVPYGAGADGYLVYTGPLKSGYFTFSNRLPVFILHRVFRL